MLRPERQVSLSRASLVPCRAKPYDARAMARVREGDQGTGFRWHQADSPAKDNFTAWCIFPASTTYFGDSRSDLMVNYVVDHLDAVLEALREEGVWVDPKVEEYDYGKFGWIVDPDGNRIELWEPLPKREKR